MLTDRHDDSRGPLHGKAVSTTRELVLDGAGVSSLPADLDRNPRIERLSAYNNSLTSLPYSLWALTGLRCLNVSVNRIESLPREIGALNHLCMLDLEHNAIGALPDEIGNLVELEFFYVSDNCLS